MHTRGANIAIMHISGVFLSTDNDEFVLMLIQGQLAGLMVQLDPKFYRNYMIISKRVEPMLYVKHDKVLYGMLKSAFLFYKKLVAELVSSGFKANQYNPFISNRMVNRKQSTVIWHVDDLKISHVDQAINTKLIGSLAKIYRNKITMS